MHRIHPVDIHIYKDFCNGMTAAERFVADRNPLRPPTTTQPTMKLLRPTLTILLAGSSIAFVSCKSEEEKRQDKALERHADALEDQAKMTRKAGEREAAAIKDEAAAAKEAADLKAKQLEEAAKETRDAK
ncbi:hypothetical protein llg_08720 [Luteolibacter sp. LG18]|nr:hypothetical protein llg_08720 [Luteolibacter sp. LG18]